MYGKQGITLALHLGDLLKQQLKTIEFSIYLSLEMLRQATAVSGAKLLKAYAAIFAKRLIAADALGEK